MPVTRSLQSRTGWSGGYNLRSFTPQIEFIVQHMLFYDRPVTDYDFRPEPCPGMDYHAIAEHDAGTDHRIVLDAALFTDMRIIVDDAPRN